MEKIGRAGGKEIDLRLRCVRKRMLRVTLDCEQYWWDEGADSIEKRDGTMTYGRIIASATRVKRSSKVLVAAIERKALRRWIVWHERKHHRYRDNCSGDEQHWDD